MKIPEQIGSETKISQTLIFENGPNVRRICLNDPELLNRPDFSHNVDFYHLGSGSETALIFIPGLDPYDKQVFLKSSLFRELGKTDNNLVLFDWSICTTSPKLAAAVIEDFCEDHNLKSVKILALCYGGRIALDLIDEISRSQSSLDIEKLVTVRSPTDIDDLWINPRITNFFVERFKSEKLRLWLSKLTEQSSNFSSDQILGIINRINDLKTPSDLKESKIPLLAITTKGRGLFLGWGPETPDLLVDNQKAFIKLRSFFSNLIEFQATGVPLIDVYNQSSIRLNRLGAHTVSSDSSGEMRQAIVNFLR